jgi:GntR family transcriptional regulator/MocR family aminotransferase
MTACQWLTQAIRSKILNGQLATGSRLPSSREIANRHGVVRGTVVGSVEQLKAEGYQ